MNDDADKVRVSVDNGANVSGGGDNVQSADNLAAAVPRVKRNFPRYQYFIAGFLAVVVVLFVVWIAGLLHFGRGTLSRSGTVCNSEIVDRLNNMIDTMAERAEIVDEFRENPRWRRDATCTVVMFTYAQDQGNVELMQESLDLTKQLADRHQFPDAWLNSRLPIPAMESFLQSWLDRGEVDDLTDEPDEIFDGEESEEVNDSEDSGVSTGEES
jgi:hypothetical protein